MTLLGLDFDNTIVQYDSLFYKLGLEKGLIDESVDPLKNKIRDFLRGKGQEEELDVQGD